ncbi:MAG: exodeoxyribonuclease VII large subunit [Blastochloris viridis]|uniref:Exodeoxyribonuclease 7 large subunit n=1 Tax=Blastochloris viridis TaxID=1079 RepID=A0A6N4RCN6_BLAVI|nr:MAG: exodeoxyribonuclease VII large subunit [Blastochloris viridis]
MRDLFDVPDEVELDVAPAVLPVWTVTELAAKVKARVEAGFGSVVVQGEISGGKLHSSGHFYFDIKDAGAVINGVAWRSTVSRWAKVPANGTLVVVKGKLTTYAQRSSYQILADSMEPAGLGALMQQLEELKQRLMAEGLFDASEKRAIPLLPKRIGIITSPTGAVIQDMLHRIADRCPREVVLWPVAVQGTGAAEQVAAAIEGFNALPDATRPDVLIVARGGGSFEDLMPFNAEVVVRAVAGSAIPVVSGVGHEPDVTLCDFAADIRAPTPSAAAEMVVPVREDLLYGLTLTQRRMRQTMVGQIAELRQRLAYMQRLLPDPRRQVVQAGQRLGELDERLRKLVPQRVNLARERLEAMARVLAAHGPDVPLARGYVYLTRDGQPLRSANAEAGAMTIHFKDGQREGTLA